MRKKWTPRPYELWDSASVERWLEDEAAKGWRMTGCSGWCAAFQRAAAYREMGWDCAAVICGGGDIDCEVYYCNDPAVPELDTDPVAFAWAWEKPLRRSWWAGWLYLALILAVMALPMLISGKSVLECLLAPQLYRLFWLPIVFCLAVMIVRRLWHLRRIRRQLAAGVVPSAGNWRWDRRWQQVFTLLLLLFWVLMLSSNIAAILWQTEPDTSGLPYTAPGSLVENTDKGYWEFEIDNYAWRSTALAPARTGSQFRGENGEHIRNATDRLRFPLLAKALYRERAADFRKDHPDAVETAVERGAFEEAVLLSEGDEQMFLARRGTVVYALWVDFPVDLSGSIEDVAAQMEGASCAGE